MNDTLFIIEYQTISGAWQTACDIDGAELTYDDFDEAMSEASKRLGLAADDGLRVRKFVATTVYAVGY
jgi:hypothetical protein